jgi:hypothetical protein
MGKKQGQTLLAQRECYINYYSRFAGGVSPRFFPVCLCGS